MTVASLISFVGPNRPLLTQCATWQPFKIISITAKEDLQAPLTLSFAIVNYNILLRKKDNSSALWLQWYAEEVKYVTMSHGRNTHRLKNVLLPCRPFPWGAKMEMYVCFCIWVLYSAQVKRDIDVSSGTFWQVTRHWWKENRLKMTAVAVFFNRFQMGPCCVGARHCK